MCDKMNKIILIGILVMILVSGCQYDNPDDCENSFRTNTPNSEIANQIYQSPNCFETGYDGEYYTMCCNDDGVRYQK